MSTYFRRLIARKIVRTVNKRVQENSANEERLIRDVASCIKLQRVNKKLDVSQPQYFLAKTRDKLKTYLTRDYIDELRSVTAEEIQESSDNVVTAFEVDENNMKIKVDSKTLNKEVLNKVLKERENFGYIPLREDSNVKTVLVEYSSPNIAKPFHAGHLRSTIIGNVISNLYEAAGHRVIRINYLGDWGTQFGLLSHGFDKYGSTEELDKNPIHHLFQVYVQINKDVEEEKKSHVTTTHNKGMEMFKLLEDGDEKQLSNWKKFRDLSLTEYSKIYKRLGLEFTDFEGESMYLEHTKALVNRLKLENLLQTDETGYGYVEVNTTSNPQSSHTIIVKRDGTSLYLTRDIAAVLDRYERYKFDKIHYVVEEGQSLHFERLVGVLQKLNVTWPALSAWKDIHIKFGRIEGMSTRKGNVVLLEDIINEAKERMLESMQNRKTTKETEDMEEVADILGITGIIVQDLFSRRILDYKFSWEKMLNFNSDSGVFLQYAHARICSLLRMNSDENFDSVCNIGEDLVECLREPEAHRLILQICGYEDAVQYALESKEPYHITIYLFRLAHLMNACHYTLKVKDQPHDTAQARILLFLCAKLTINNGLKLLGIKPLEKM